MLDRQPLVQHPGDEITGVAMLDGEAPVAERLPIFELNILVHKRFGGVGVEPEEHDRTFIRTLMSASIVFSGVDRKTRRAPL